LREEKDNRKTRGKGKASREVIVKIMLERIDI